MKILKLRFSNINSLKGNFSIDFGVYGMAFVNGLYVANSSTAATLTAGAADCQFFARIRA